MDLDRLVSELHGAFERRGLAPPRIECCKEDIRVSGFGIIRPDEEYEIHDLTKLGDGPLETFHTEFGVAEFVAKKVSEVLG